MSVNERGLVVSIKIELQGPSDEVEAALVLIERFFHVLDEPPAQDTIGPHMKKILYAHVEDLLSGFSTEQTSASPPPAASPAPSSLFEDKSQLDSLTAELSTLTEVYRYALRNMETPQNPKPSNASEE